MFDVGFDEMLVIAVIAIVVIGPKDLPRALRMVGQWVAKVRRVSGHFRTGVETMIREAELEEMERKWREQNEAIMKAHPGASAGSAEAGAAGSHAAQLQAAAPTEPLPDPLPADLPPPAAPGKP